MMVINPEFIYFAVILKEILEAFNAPETVRLLMEAKESSGNEMIKMMQHVFPIVVQIEMDVIKNHGFPEGREGTKFNPNKLLALNNIKYTYF